VEPKSECVSKISRTFEAVCERDVSDMCQVRGIGQ
jgi:hypothetical protein